MEFFDIMTIVTGAVLLIGTLWYLYEQRQPRELRGRDAREYDVRLEAKA